MQIKENEIILWAGCGFDVPGFTAVSSANQLTVVFVSDRSIVYEGFEAAYSQTLEGESNFPDSGETDEVTMSPAEQGRNYP